ncbi:MAG: flavodoxin family protein [Aristaeellaceae bacterium]
MSKKVLILSGSPRRGGNSDLMCDEFARGAAESGHEVEKIRVAAKKIAPCSACYFCREHHGQCVHQDDMAEVLQKMIDADVLVLASPVYFYAIDAQLKAVIDRTVARWLEVKNKEFYYIVTMADEDPASADTTLACLRGYADCVEGAVEKGVIVAGSVYEPGRVKGMPAMADAYTMGKNV